MPSKRYLEANATMDPNQGFAGMMPRKSHYRTRTFGQSRLDTSRSYRSEIGRDLAEYIRILKEDGSWTPQVRQSLMR